MNDPSDRFDQIFWEALEISSDDERRAFLDQACGGDTRLRQRVEKMLKAKPKAEPFFENPLAVVAATIGQPASEQPGTYIGPYKLVEEIGEGGMGSVFMALQKKPVRRKVALKVIKPGMDSKQVVSRFEAERQVLAMMDHPNIARVIDGGTTESGRPYFVMDLVKGIPITDYCDRYRLTTNDRLAVFGDVCSAVRHAHQKGIIHRDLKPSNILVTVLDGRAIPKVIDFGIAKATTGHLTEDSLVTAFSQMVGTPMYMSPEQAEVSAADVDTRSDVYSLGVLLYELLTGTTPFDRERMSSVSFDEFRRIVREEDPPRPSTRLSTLNAALTTIADKHHTDPRTLSHQVRGDLDWIVMKALEKDRTRRYESAHELAKDVQRYLADEPVQARPPSLAHHAAKWVRRHRPLVWSTSVVLIIATLAGGAVFWTDYRRAAQVERDVGEHLVAATAFFGSEDYHAADRKLAEARGRLETAGYRAGPLEEQVTALTSAIAAKAKALESYGQFQNLRHRVHSEMYAVDRDILDQAQEHCRAALDLFGVFQADTWKSQVDFENLNTERQSLLDEGAVELLFIWARLEMGKSDAQPEAERSAGYRRAIETLGKIENIHSRIPAVSLWMADCWEAMGEKQASAEARTRAESLRPTSATNQYLLGEYHAQHGQQDQALASYWQALAQQPDHYLSLLAAGVALGELKEYKSAEAMLTGAIAMHPQTVIAYVKRAAARSAQSKIVLAQADVEEAKKRDPELARALIRRGGEYLANLQLDKASADYSEAIRLEPQAAAYEGRGITYLFQGDLDKALADCNEYIRFAPGSAGAYSVRAEIYRLQGDLVRAMVDANEGLRLDPKHASTYLCRGRIYGHRGEWDKAIADLHEAIRLEPKDAGFYTGRGDIYLQLGEREKALADHEEAIRIDPKNVWGHLGLADVYRHGGDFDKALAAFNEAVRTAPQYSLPYSGRAAFYRDRGDFEKALADYNEAVRLAPQYAAVYSCRAAFYKERGDFDRALADYEEAIRIDPKNVWSHLGLADVYRHGGDFDKALAAFNEAVRTAPQYSLPYSGRAAFYRDRGDFEKALADYNEAVRLAPQYAAVYSCRAAFYKERGDFDRALADASEAIRVEPQNGAWYCQRGEIYLGLCQFEEAAADYDRAVELAELTPISWHHYKRRALAHFRLKHYDKALESIARAVELNPGDGSNLWWIPPVEVAQCPDERLRQGLVELADKAIEKTQGDGELHAARAMLYHAFGRRDEARVDFDKAVQLDPQGAVLWYLRALTQLSGGQADEYRRDCGEMLRRFGQTDEADNRHWVAWTCVLAPDDARDWTTAVALAEKAVQSDLKSARNLNTLGAVLYRARRFEEALARLSEATTLIQQPSEANMDSPAYNWFFLAMAHHRLRHAEEAKQWLNKAVAWTEKTFAEADGGTVDLRWNRRLTLTLLRDEATTLLGVTLPAGEPAREPVKKEEEKPK